MTTMAYLYICDGDIDHPVLTHKKMDWPEKYPHWQEIPLVMAKSEHTWVGLTDEELAEFSEAKLGAYDLCLEVEAKLREKNT